MPRKRDISYYALAAATSLAVIATEVHDYKKSNAQKADQYNIQYYSSNAAKPRRRHDRHDKRLELDHDDESDSDSEYEDSRAPLPPRHYEEQRLEYPRHSSRDPLKRSWSSGSSSVSSEALKYTNDTLARYHAAEPDAVSAPMSRALAHYSQPSASSSVLGDANNGWKWDNAKNDYYYDAPDGQIRMWRDGTKESLRPPPIPEAPKCVKDEGRNMWYWRDETAKCWVYENGSKIPFT